MYKYICLFLLFIDRYYLNQFRDAYRQAAFDIIQGGIFVSFCFSIIFHHVNQRVPQIGKPVLPDASVEKLNEEEPSSVIDRVRNLLADCQKQLLTDPMTVVGSWGLINADPVSVPHLNPCSMKFLSCSSFPYTMFPHSSGLVI